MAVRHRHAPGDVEHEHLRTARTKHFRTADGKQKIIASIRPLHWRDVDKFVDLDREPTSNDGGTTWTTPSTPYHINWNSKTLTLSYASKKGGSVEVKLVALDGQPVPTPDKARLSKFSVFCRVGRELEIELRCRPHGVEIFKILHGPNAPKSLTWEVTEDRTGAIHLDLMSTSGRDNMALSKKRDGEFSHRRLVEIAHSRTPDDFVSKPGKVTYQVTETFTGRARLTNTKTRARTWVNDFAYPVIIDVTITETPAADNDDGFEVGGTWYAYGGSPVGQRFDSGGPRRPGYRFTTVAIPQGQTLDTATLTLEVLSTTGAVSAGLFGNAVDNAPAWANGAGPADMTVTSASTTLNAGTTGTKVLDVKTIAQEIVNRAGWANNNAMSFGVNGAITGGGAAQIADTYDATPADDPLLTIVYTTAAALGLGKLTSNPMLWFAALVASKSKISRRRFLSMFAAIWRK